MSIFEARKTRKAKGTWSETNFESWSPFDSIITKEAHEMWAQHLSVVLCSQPWEVICFRIIYMWEALYKQKKAFGIIYEFFNWAEFQRANNASCCNLRNIIFATNYYFFTILKWYLMRYITQKTISFIIFSYVYIDSCVAFIVVIFWYSEISTLQI